MKQQFYTAIIGNPIIAAIKSDMGLRDCIEAPEVNVVFVLYGEVGTIADVVEQLKEAGKTVVVHVDLIAGLNSREEAVNFIARYTKADGIISTKIELIKRARELKLTTIYRMFVIDSKVFDNMSHHFAEQADIVEILPGLMPKIIRKMTRMISVPIIAGGLITDKEDVIQALDAGAIAISTTNENVWSM
ncbi:MAG: glycerol-3-phosphate responsive antiterminator [Lachnospiraceae bacterium]|nr:glycerol-3-phosphate responsive antiterminator [Lachnospiraceae bacterium]